ncbi:MAG: hypothetical protein Q9220_005419 [cf. Caloplaca sp. 1 TL-2023]
MLRDEAFSSTAKVDRYGRRLPKNAGRKELEKFYRLQEEEERPIEDSQVESELAKADTQNEQESASSAEDSSSEDESSSDEMEEEEVFGLLDGQGADGGDVPMGEVTPRLAIVNLDWDNIRAADLMAVFSSFVSSEEHIKKISVYPSEFGKERIEREETEGPPAEIFTTGKMIGINGSRNHDLEEEEEEEEDRFSPEEDDERIKKSLLQEGTDQEFNSAKLRRYQLERLRYYYAVIHCSSSSVAKMIYDAVDGTEYLTTANFFDLRFIPDDVEFSQDKPRDECTRIPDGYRPNEFVTDALQHSKVKLTWDADDGTRKEAQKRAFTASRANIDENDLKAYLGSDSSEDELDVPEPVVFDATTADTAVTGELPTNDIPSELPSRLSKKEAERRRMRALLGLDDNSKLSSQKLKSDTTPSGDMQVTFSSGLTSSQSNTSVFANSPDDNEETTVEKYIRKEKERKARRKSKPKADGTPPDINESPEEEENDQGDDTLPREHDDGEQDLGFSDPFFSADPSTTTTTTTNSSRKETKRLKKARLAAEEAVASAKRAELELLTLSDNETAAAIIPGNNTTTNNNPVRHFNINDILKAEKTLSKKHSKKRKRTEREKDALAAKERDNFQMDTKDPRFGAVFQSAEFAIDPTHPRFLGTGAMKEMLEEGRRKRGRRKEVEEDGGGDEVGERRGREGRGEDDMDELVKRVKGRTRR